MKSKVRKLLKRQDGQIFLIALVLLAIGGLMLPPLLSFMGTGIKVSELHEEEMLSLYAADAGIEDALYVLKYQSPDIGEFPIIGNITNINGNSVEYFIELDIIGEDTQSYAITSTATDIIDDSATTIEVFIQVTEIYYTYGVLTLDGDLDLSGAALTLGSEDQEFPVNVHANGNIIRNGNLLTVWGDVTATGTIDNDIVAAPPYEKNAGVDYDVIVEIDTSDSSSYFLDAMGGDYYGGDLTIDGYTELGPAYIDGDLIIKSTGTVNLTGHVWVAGSLNINGDLFSTANVSENTPIEDMHAIVLEQPFVCNADIVSIGSDGNYPLFISLYEGDSAMSLTGGYIGAILYAPNGQIDIAGNADVEGAAIGKYVEINGNYNATYPFPAQVDDNERELDILSYIIK
ncbi:hypothetical protein ACFLXY_09370 [Chloroflexota bacterium]